MPGSRAKQNVTLRVRPDGPGRVNPVKNPRTAWIVYTVLRLLFFAIPFALLYVRGIWPWLAAVFAALIGVSLSIIFLSKPRATASESIYDWRTRDRTADDIVEDEAVDVSDVEASRPADEPADAEAKVEANTDANLDANLEANAACPSDAERG